MLSIGVVRSSMAAASYFAKDNYYTQHEEGPSHWFGAGAEKLGLTGEVEAGRFKELLEGRIDAETRLGRIRDGEHQHLHGWDLTFSAPKSVSLAALVGGDERLVAAHDAAVREALGWLQENALSTRSRPWRRGARGAHPAHGGGGVPARSVACRRAAAAQPCRGHERHHRQQGAVAERPQHPALRQRQGGRRALPAGARSPCRRARLRHCAEPQRHLRAGWRAA